MTWCDRLLRLTANWHWDADAQLLCLRVSDSRASRGRRTDSEFWSNVNASPIVHSL